MSTERGLAEAQDRAVVYMKAPFSSGRLIEEREGRGR